MATGSTLDALVVGGFEPSGHDSITTAVVEAGIARGHTVRRWDWRDEIDCDHPLFALHRVAAAAGEPEAAVLLDDGRLSDGLARDLAGRLPLADARVVISTHPWSTVVCSRDIAPRGAAGRPLLVDCHGEFTPLPIPLVGAEQVDAFVGGVSAAPLKPSDRSRVWLTGVPVRASFAGPAPSAPRGRVLAVNPGHGSWAFDATASLVAEAVERFGLERVAIFQQEDDDVRARWRGSLGSGSPQLDFATTSEEIAAVLAAAPHLLTKASGSAIAEALAMGCVPLCLDSGIFWERDARAHLSALRAVLPVELGRLGEIDPGVRLPAVGRIGARCRAAAGEIWSIVEEGARQPAVRPGPTAAHISARLNGDGPLVATSDALRQVLDGWL